MRRLLPDFFLIPSQDITWLIEAGDWLTAAGLCLQDKSFIFSFFLNDDAFLFLSNELKTSTKMRKCTDSDLGGKQFIYGTFAPGWVKPALIVTS
jgi:hypothetical protein